MSAFSLRSKQASPITSKECDRYASLNGWNILPSSALFSKYIHGNLSNLAQFNSNWLTVQQAKKEKLSLQQAVEAHRVVRRRGSHIFYTIGLQMAVRLPALSASRPLPPGRFLVLISVRGWFYPRAIVRLEGLGQLKTSSGIEPATFRLAA
jgi:hypothetical protein